MMKIASQQRGLSGVPGRCGGPDMAKQRLGPVVCLLPVEIVAANRRSSGQLPGIRSTTQHLSHGRQSGREAPAPQPHQQREAMRFGTAGVANAAARDVGIPEQAETVPAAVDRERSADRVSPIRFEARGIDPRVSPAIDLSPPSGSASSPVNLLGFSCVPLSSAGPWAPGRGPRSRREPVEGFAQDSASLRSLRWHRRNRCPGRSPRASASGSGSRPKECVPATR